MAHIVYDSPDGWYGLHTNIEYTERYLVCLEGGQICIVETNPVGILTNYIAGSSLPAVVDGYKPN